ncbi:MAG: TnsA endonuclease N-terminal domain-containing protein [Lachnospiraceae bacterium]|nr:TnsA endonuclease N-terminal domain-containing protein [Lachnospiraceae bacterium]
MPRRTSTKRKFQTGRGTGSGSNYKPWIKARDISSIGTKGIIKDWKDGRQRHLLSQNEVYFYYILRWDDAVTDIREQFPLNIEKTKLIASKLGVKHPGNGYEPMTTDFLVDYIDDKGIVRQKAYSVKSNRSVIFGSLDNPQVARAVEIQRIEMSYWKLNKIPFKIIFGDELNKTFVSNIATVTSFYDIKTVNTPQSFLLWLLAHKYIKVDMESASLDYPALTEEYLSSPEKIARQLSAIPQDEAYLIKMNMNKLTGDSF